MSSCIMVPAGQGKDYAWENDHIFVKIAGSQTGGAFSIVEDNLKTEFALGLHNHREHSETFYILEGAVKFYIDGAWMTAGKGTTVHIPAGVPHAVKMAGGPGKMLMIFQPAFFEDYLAALGALGPTQLADTALQKNLAEQYDIYTLGDVPAE